MITSTGLEDEAQECLVCFIRLHVVGVTNDALALEIGDDNFFFVFLNVVLWDSTMELSVPAMSLQPRENQYD